MFQIFKKWYYKSIYLIENFKYSSILIGFFAFIESIFFPIPPDIFLIMLGIAKHNKVFWYAFITTAFSVLGGLIGYFLGYYLYDVFIENLLIKIGYIDYFNKFQDMFNNYQALAVFIAGFTPFPYKIVTISSGVLHANLFEFIIFSLLSRGLRFFLLAWIIHAFKTKDISLIKKYFIKFAWLISIVFIIGLIIWYYL